MLCPLASARTGFFTVTNKFFLSCSCTLTIFVLFKKCYFCSSLPESHRYSLNDVLDCYFFQHHWYCIDAFHLFSCLFSFIVSLQHAAHFTFYLTHAFHTMLFIALSITGVMHHAHIQWFHPWSPSLLMLHTFFISIHYCHHCLPYTSLV